MPLSVDNIIQSATGSFKGTSGSVTLPSGTTAGNAVFIFATILGDNTSSGTGVSTSPTGFVLIASVSSSFRYHANSAMIKKSASDGETSWTLGMSNATFEVLWYVCELAGADVDWPDSQLPYAQAVRTANLPSATTVTTNTAPFSGSSETYDGFSMAFFVTTGTDTSVPVISDYNRGFFEIANASVIGTARSLQLSVAAKMQNVIETVNCTASVSPTAYVSGSMFIWTATNARHVPLTVGVFGGEIGTATQITNANASGTDELANGPAPWDGAVGSPEIVTTNARSGSYCMRLSSTSAAENVTWVTSTSVPSKAGVLSSGRSVWVERFHVYFDSLPSVDTELASVEHLESTLVIRYVTASQKIGVKVGAAAEVLSDATVSAGKWIGIDYEYDTRGTDHVCRWAVDYDATPGDTTDSVPQATVSETGTAFGVLSVVRKGWRNAITATVYYDDIVGNTNRHGYPIGDVRIFPLKVDPTATPTVTGTSANFRTFTNNGTLATWTAATTKTALDEIPPIVGASSDGLAQITVAAADYVTVPMETFTCAPDYAPFAARWYWAGWAASGNPATFLFKAADGIGDASFPLVGDVLDSGFDSTNLVWVTSIHNPDNSHNTVYPLTQAYIDGLAARFGFSTDANPDAGVHAVLVELAVMPTRSIGVIAVESGAFDVYMRMDPLTYAITGLLATTPAGTRGATLTWTLDGTPDSHYVGPNTAYEHALPSTDIRNVTAIGLVPDPTE